MVTHTEIPTINTHDLLIQRPYADDGRWYVQEVALLDVGRFDTYEEAVSHSKFIEEKFSESTPSPSEVWNN